MIDHAFPISKQRSNKKMKDKHMLSDLAANKINGTVEMRNFNNRMKDAQSFISIAKNRMPSFVLLQRPLLTDMPLLE